MSFYHLEIENGDNNTNSCDKKDEGDADKEDYHIFVHYFPQIINLLSFPVNKFLMKQIKPFSVECWHKRRNGFPILSVDCDWFLVWYGCKCVNFIYSAKPGWVNWNIRLNRTTCCLFHKQSKKTRQKYSKPRERSKYLS